ncbi:3',5'-cyclic-nucleotide phosphodiesterase [Burkholderia sp. WAC0059]|uniref:3',5'-cyclic-nucleotide phosphodiesterase n=1 Tax=Burkholderia sp. WAC0059 TaxID=2066022 RepID=UPI000C7EBD62|nr:3',5'-cyclic-nucleotide phosphodiesterase [Burkholderia sp. WAC0059]PLZ00637.1 3',5'-cyclic-nucleotide phosphodiesterase [Burkholderia sp. WAC0059]
MKVTVLGCSGGIGAGRAGARTTALLVDDDMLIDAGTGVGDLGREALARIDRVFVTHTHIDHVACLPLIMDAVGERRAAPLVVHCTRDTEAALREHLFNDRLWPDFTRIPDAARPFLRFAALEVGEPVACDHPVHGARTIVALPAEHTVPAVGYRLDGARGSLAFSGDTTVCGAFADALARIGSLRHLIVETAFPDAQRDLARASKHLCPSLLAELLAAEDPRFELWITHIKPGAERETMRENRALLRRFRPKRLARGHVFDF